MYEEGQAKGGVPEDALPVYEKACQAGYAEACTRLGRIFIKGKIVEQDMAKGVKLVQSACDKGDAEGCDALGQVYEAGSGVPADLTKAAALYVKSCDGGSGRGCYHLAKLYQTGKGVARDDAKAGTLLAKACELGHSKSCGLMAEVYLNGTGVPKDVPKALALYDSACSGGDAEACATLGSIYRDGTAVPADAKKSFAYMEKACTSGATSACFGVAQAYERGTGVAQDFVRASELYSKACKAGMNDACVAGGKVAFQSKFTELVVDGLKEDQCTVYGLDPNNPDNTKPVAKVQKNYFQLLTGPRKGTHQLEDAAIRFEIDGGISTGYSAWTVGKDKDALTFDYVEVWNSEEDPLDDFPTGAATSKDRKGGGTLEFLRDEDTVERDGDGLKCGFSGGYPQLSTDGCSAVQAMVAAQLLSECKGE
jgi:TPR repeat protein